MSVLRPRDIQTRIRAGETPEDVAAAAHTSVDKIMGFATPVLAERAYQAQLAQRASVRRRAASGHVGNLGAAVSNHLEALEVDPDTVEWDAWRREDGRWTVVAAYLAEGEHRQAAFSYDAAGRYVVAEDDEARALVGERSGAPERLVEAPEPTLEAVPDPLDDLLPPQAHEEPHHQLQLGDDALSLVTGRSPTPTTEDPRPRLVEQRELEDPELPATPATQPAAEVTELQGEVTLDLTEASTAVRGAPAATADADWMATQATERPEATAGPREAAETAEPGEPVAPRTDGAPGSEPWDTPGEEADPEGEAREEEQAADTLFEVPDPPQRAARAGRSRGRASVPSWDEIMFGTPKSE